MDEPIFDPVTYALLKSQLNTDNIQNESEYVTGEDLTEIIDTFNRKLTPTQITPVLNATSFEIATHNVQYMGGYALGNIVIKCIADYVQDNNQYITMPWTFGTYATYAFQPCTITDGEWDRTASRNGRVYCNAYDGTICFPSCSEGEYISIYICLPVTLNS